MIHEHMKKFAGMPVRDWGTSVDWDELTDREAAADTDEESPDPAFPPLRQSEKTLYRIALDYDEADSGVTWGDKLRWFLTQKGVERVAGIVAGPWGTGSDVSSVEVIKPLAKAAKKLAGLRAVFVGDIVMEENEISWIAQSDLGPLLRAYPQLQHLGVRGGDKLKFQTPGHERLKTLVVESGGLPARVLHQIFQAEWPELEHLELWLGTAAYGADTTVEDITPLLSGARFPKLRHLGLRDSEIADDIAAVLAGAPLLKQLQVLDLSLGTLSDVGAKALLASRAVKKLKKLDLHHHYCSSAMVKRLKGLGVRVDVRGRKEADDEQDRFVAVGE